MYLRVLLTTFYSSWLIVFIIFFWKGGGGHTLHMEKGTYIWVVLVSKCQCDQSDLLVKNTVMGIAFL